MEYLIWRLLGLLISLYVSHRPHVLPHVPVEYLYLEALRVTYLSIYVSHRPHVLPHVPVEYLYSKGLRGFTISPSIRVPQTPCTPTRSRWSTCRESSGPTREVATAQRATSTPGSMKRPRKTSCGHTPLPSLPECSTNSANRYYYRGKLV